MIVIKHAKTAAVHQDLDAICGWYQAILDFFRIINSQILFFSEMGTEGAVDLINR